MKKYLYYHIYLTEETGCWYNHFLEQVVATIDSGLYEHIEKMYVVCIGKKEEVEMFTGICNTFGKIEILEKIILDDDTEENLSLQHVSKIDYQKKNIHDETLTMKYLQEHAKREDAHFMYFHAKGITVPWRMREEKIYQPFVNYYFWRKFLQWGCIENWKLCTDKLEDHSVSGVNFGTWPVPHYSGGFWWTKSEYVNKLPDITENDWWNEMRRTTPLNTFDSNRNKPEMWIGAKYNNDFFNIVSHPIMPPVGTLVQNTWPRFCYEGVVQK